MPVERFFPEVLVNMINIFMTLKFNELACKIYGGNDKILTVA